MMRDFRYLLPATAAIVFAAALAAQDVVIVQRRTAPPAPPAIPASPTPPMPPSPPDIGFATAIAQAPTFEFIAAQPAFLERTVTGAPYTAESVSETTRVLADGTRIKNENTSKISRDGEGRVRKEQAFGHIGFWVPKEGAASTQITITDPVAKKTIILNPGDKTARVMPMPSMPGMPGMPGMPAPPAPPTPPAGATGKARIERTEEHSVTITQEGDRTVVFQRNDGVDARGSGIQGEIQAGIAPAPPGSGAMVLPRRMMTHSMFDPENVKVENLGERTVQGVKATGTRSTTTIPTGAIGNDRPIVSVLEQWTSPELGVVVLRTLQDPQIGETVYRLENIDRSEPLKSLFEVPAGYEVKESQPRIQRMEMRKRSDGE